MRKLKVGKSKIAGKGLFTTDAFEQGEMIGLAHENDQPTSFIGKYHNHSDNPNAVNVKFGDKRYLMAKRPLKRGEEITTNYRLQPELEQPEDFKKEKGGQMTPQKDGYRTYSPFKQLPYIDVESDTIDSDNIVYDLNLQADNGLSKFIEKNTGLHTIPGAKVIREIPVKKQGGLVKMPKPSKKGLASKKFSKSLDATNKLFTENYLFSKSKSRKNKVFDPNAKYYEDGGELPMAEYGMPMGGGMSQNYMGRRKFIHQDGGAYYDDSRDAWVSADGKVGPNGPAYYQEGGDIISQSGWDYKKEGDKYLTKKVGSENWIEAQGKPLQAIKQNVFQETSAPTPVVSTPVQPTAPTQAPVSGNQEVLELQRKLKDAGYNLGTYGPNKDGVDGVMGNTTKLAYDAFKANIPPNEVKVPKKTTKPTINYTVNRDLPDGYLPVIQPGQEACVEGKGCSFNVSVKMGDLLGNIADGPVWANDAWFNKSDVLNKGGDLVYDSNSKIYNQMGKVPKEVYSKLQVGDYVQLNRTDTKSSAEFAAQTKDGLQNEQIEHLGFIVGKDKDGTPLVWHGSETGKAFIKRIDEPITLDDHDKNIFTYKVSSIVRSPNLKDVDFSGLQNSPYYTPVDPNKKLVPKQGATETQVQATKSFNNAVGQFKNLGYSQDDTNYVGQILIGGIMTRESKGAEDWKVAPKQAAAYLIKDVAGIKAFDVNVPGIGKVRVPGKEFEGDQASVGVYQIKPEYNFKTKDGGLNPLGKKLQKLGFNVDDITSDNIQAQTVAGTLILLDNYKKLKENPDFDVKTNLYKGKIPASYILAKSWNAGSGWESREKYEKFLDDLDINYSNKALNEAADFIEVTGGKSINSELSSIEQQQKQILEKKQQENAKKQFAVKQQDLAVRADTVRRFPTIAESTAVNTNYTQKGPKPFNASTYIQQGPTKTVYTYSGRPGAMYKKDAKGNWYINLGNQTGNQFVKIDDKDGSRTAILNKGAVPTVPKTFKTGGIYMELSDSEIEEFRRGGYIIEDLD
jgi:hypothetical protein